MAKNRVLPLLSALFLFVLFSGCKERQCFVPIGLTNFEIEPNSSYYSGLNNVGGYMYLTGGHRGVVVVRLALDRFVAYERTCPADSTTAVEITDDWGSALLECPKCHTCFIVDADGMPMDGGATACPLYQYSTSYSGGVLWVY